jgi:hypothetical protein
MLIIILLYNSCIAKLLYFSYNKGPFVECDKEENVEVSGAATTSV